MDLRLAELENNEAVSDLIFKKGWLKVFYFGIGEFSYGFELINWRAFRNFSCNYRFFNIYLFNYLMRALVGVKRCLDYAIKVRVNAA